MRQYKDLIDKRESVTTALIPSPEFLNSSLNIHQQCFPNSFDHKNHLRFDKHKILYLFWRLIQ